MVFFVIQILTNDGFNDYTLEQLNTLSKTRRLQGARLQVDYS